MFRIRRSFIILIALLILPGLKAQQTQPFFPLSQVHRGLVGTGRTVFEGNKIEEFRVELIGVLKNVLAPKRDAILARLSGPQVAREGVAAGMSGSPVYVDGKLLGAVAIAFPFAKEPYTLITPIEDMLQVVPRASASAAGESARYGSWWASEEPVGAGAVPRWLPEEASTPQAWLQSLPFPALDRTSNLMRLPLRFGGFAGSVVESYASIFRTMGFEPAAADGLSGLASSEATASEAASQPIQPGSMISLVLMRGDLNLTADCTVTYRQGDNLYACGHQILAVGEADIPFARSEVLATIPSVLSSFKVDTSGPLAGSIRQDRFGAIYGVLGAPAPTIPVDVRLSSTLNRQANYHFEVAEGQLLAPLLTNVAIVSLLTSTERVVGPSTYELKGQIRLSTGDSISLEDVASSDLNSTGSVGAAVAGPLKELLDGQYAGLRVEGINLNIVSREQSRIARLEQVWSTLSEVRPGDHIEVIAVERTPSGERLTQRIPIEIPESVNSQTLSLLVGSGPAVNALERGFVQPGNPPRDLRQMVKELNRTRRNNRLYALLMVPQRSFKLEGDEFPSPPPSLLQTFLADPAISNAITFRGSSVIGDYETPPGRYVIQGEQTLLVRVVTPAK